MSPLTVYILCRNHAYFKRHWKRFHRNEWEKHLFSFLMSIIPLTWRSSAVRTNVWKCFLAIFSVSKKSLCGSEICVLQRGQWFLEVWTRQPTGNAVSFFFFFPSLKLQQSQKYFRNMWENILKNMSLLRCKNINELQYCPKQKTFVFWGDERLLNENLNEIFFRAEFIGSYYSWKLK